MILCAVFVRNEQIWSLNLVLYRVFNLLITLSYLKTDGAKNSIFSQFGHIYKSNDSLFVNKCPISPITPQFVPSCSLIVCSNFIVVLHLKQFNFLGLICSGLNLMLSEINPSFSFVVKLKLQLQQISNSFGTSFFAFGTIFHLVFFLFNELHLNGSDSFPLKI